MFVGFDVKDGAALYDTQASAIERAKVMIQWSDDPNAKVMVHRTKIPLWLAHLVRGTPFEWIGYKEAL